MTTLSTSFKFLRGIRNVAHPTNEWTNNPLITLSCIHSKRMKAHLPHIHCKKRKNSLQYYHLNLLSNTAQ
ncbi:hypothetical protein QQP08_015458 [Theobroma cacao]|nr:hypothetical protein QQP08_015458 [Theobroma cacao]